MGSDLLKKFQEKKLPFVEKGEELELNLGLSLGGCFGGKPKESSLYRSTSNACTTTFWRDGDGDGVDLSLTRTSSLPAASLQETKKRKGLMDIIQMEVMKKELEMKRCCRGGDGVEAPVLRLNGSQGSGSSGITELESQSAQAQVTLNQNVTCQKNHTESSSPTSVLSSPEQPNVNAMCPKPIKMSDIKTESNTENRKAKLKNSCTSALALDKNPTDEMPHVFTRGDGP
ncbi:hypothetical protein, partial [Ralstonia pseudosolanacearum]|uniref:hypothetical protein n=1 Tax=Ralstonia pseudosolanacearum TaxID=1310165 RepID=UPI003CF74377